MVVSDGLTQFNKFWDLDMYFESLGTQMTHLHKFRDHQYTLLYTVKLNFIDGNS